MHKVVAILNVVAWSGFWAFGYLAFTANAANTGEMVTAAILAAIAGGLGMLAYLWLAWHSAPTRGQRRVAARRDMNGEITS
ncbi:hypothetical protein G5B38_09755 [Pseudohalocynthiibacter aestuariivivens]|uniref:Uncharacterized protein n=1 Tax=Roseovarius pelagicus TaxID=2980108 RepID=A0ABY6D7Z1_9RHOB|nr:MULTISPECIES: hypothetical protein [Rhodobacterales]QIE45785.1 hypothetical protein G5B38_09755 [Pseudohalocynthiibacter aestuariivivens]UXX82257.1 hypothetical protein N7U68_14255 [Roseovarius pelagicus]